MLAKKFPRIRAVSPTNESSKSSSAGEREVREWFRGLLVDLSQYADKFIEEGVDSIKLLTKVTAQDVQEFVPKRAHQRVIYEAIKSNMDTTGQFINCEDGLRIPW